MFDQENEDNSLFRETLFTNDSTSFPFDSKNRETPPWSNPTFPNDSAVSIEVQAVVTDSQESVIHNQQAPTQNHEVGSVHEDGRQKVHESGSHKSDLAIPIEALNVAPTEASLSSDSGHLIRDQDIEKSQVEGNAFAFSSRMLPSIDSDLRFCFNFAPQQFVLFPPPEPPDGIVAPTLSHSLINFHSKREYYTYAQQVVDEMPEQGVVSFLQQHSPLSSILFPPISSRASPSSAYLFSSFEIRKTPAMIPPPKPPDGVTNQVPSLNPSISVVTAACCTELKYPVSVCYRSLPTASQVFDEIPKCLVAVWIAIILDKNVSEVVALDLSKVMNQVPLFSIHLSSFIYGVVFITEYTVNDLEDIAIDLFKDLNMTNIGHRKHTLCWSCTFDTYIVANSVAMTMYSCFWFDQLLIWGLRKLFGESLLVNIGFSGGGTPDSVGVVSATYFSWRLALVAFPTLLLVIIPDTDIDVYMKAASTEGREASLLTDYVLKILGLDICADTMVGDEMHRGISGGQRKRVTTGEMLVGPAKVLFMDEISTGLDSSTTFQIVNSLRQYVHIFSGTAVISLLQPAPEAYELFDDIILISDGQIVYQGPGEYVLDFFEFMGFKCTERKGVADFLQEVTSKKDQEQYWVCRDEPYRFVTVTQFSKAFQSFTIEKRIMERIVRALARMIRESINCSSNALDSLCPCFPLSYGVHVKASEPSFDCEELEEVIWGVAGLVIGLYTFISATYRTEELKDVNRKRVKHGHIFVAEIRLKWRELLSKHGKFYEGSVTRGLQIMKECQCPQVLFSKYLGPENYDSKGTINCYGGLHGIGSSTGNELEETSNTITCLNEKCRGTVRNNAVDLKCLIVVWNCIELTNETLEAGVDIDGKAIVLITGVGEIPNITPAQFMMDVLLHRKMIFKGNALAQEMLLKWKTLPPKHGTWKCPSLRTRMF